ncbi:MAG: hypothetical protein H0T78_10615 [Longispora sp.]|nr:hypothetical protein [Longispora sp. (in: high G+C Gram-positive bacteria)]
MGTTTAVFLGIGGLSVLMLVLSFVGSHLHLGIEDIGHSITLPSIAGFFGAFGFAGAIAIELSPLPGFDVWVGSIVGLTAAVPVAFLAQRLTRIAQEMGTDATPTSESLTGAAGLVTTAIRGSDSYGEVTLTFAGQPMRFNARAHESIAAGTPVFVIGTTSPTCVLVEPAPGYFLTESSKES